MSEKEKKIVKDIKDKEENLREFYELQRVIWDRNILFHLGQQWIEIDTETRTWKSSARRYKDVDFHYPMPVTNISYDKVQTIVSNIVKSFPSPYATNRVGTDKAKRSARFSDVAVKYYEEKDNMKQQVGDAALQCLLMGGCILRPYWNLETGKYIEQILRACPICMLSFNINIEKCPQCGNELMMMMDKSGEPKIDRIPLGDPACELTSYYEWLFDPLAEELENQRWKMRRRVKSAEWINDTYGSKIKPDSTLAEEYWYKYKINFWQSTGYSFESEDNRYIEHFLESGTPFIEYWERPETKDDKGKYVILAGEQLVKEFQFPWIDGKWHDIHLRFAKEVHQFYGFPFINLLIPINNRLNRIDQQLIWNRQMCIDPILMVEQNVGVENEEFYGKLGRIINPISGKSAGISYLEQKPYPIQIYEERKFVIEDSDRLTISNVYSGQMPEGRTAAATVEMSIEQNSSKLNQFGINLAQGYVKVYREYLRLLKNNMPVERQFSILGEEHEYETFAFKGQELEGDPDFEEGGLLVRIDYDTVYPKSRAADKQMLIELMQYQFINPQDDFIRAIVYEKFGFNKDGVNNSFNIDQSAANREIILMDQGQDVSAMYAQKYYKFDLNKVDTMAPDFDPKVGLLPHQNNAIHMEIERRYVNSEKFQHLSPEIQAIHLRHLELENIALQREQQQRMQQQIMMAQYAKGAPRGIIGG
jgi:hypothetical protein